MNVVIIQSSRNSLQNGLNPKRFKQGCLDPHMVVCTATSRLLGRLRVAWLDWDPYDAGTRSRPPRCPGMEIIIVRANLCLIGGGQVTSYLFSLAFYAPGATFPPVFSSHFLIGRV